MDEVANVMTMSHRILILLERKSNSGLDRAEDVIKYILYLFG